MSWVRALACFLVFWSGTAWGATLTWDPNSDPDLAGYRVYKCSLLPCDKSSGTLLVTLGTGTSFNIGTPASTTYYFITAYDSTNKESSKSNVATYTPDGSSPPPPMRILRLTVVGNPAAGRWGVEADTTDLRNVMATVLLDGVVHHVEHTAPYGFPDDNGLTATTGQFGPGLHTVAFVFYLQGTTTEIGRANVTVDEGSPSAPPPPPALRSLNLEVVGFPATGRWGVEGSTTDVRDVMARVYLDGVLHAVQHNAPYGFPDDNGLTATMGRFGTGSHKVVFVFYREGTTTEIGRANVTVQEGPL